jgi:hypothetical protein
MQNPTGGFGGGHGQISHLAGSYAAVLALALVGGDDVFALIDRRAMCVVLLIERTFVILARAVNSNALSLGGDGWAD